MAKTTNAALFIEETNQSTTQVRGPVFNRPWFKQIHKPNKETSSRPSATVPDSSMTLTEMLQRVKRGLPINSGAQPVYNGERLLPNWKQMDLIDRANAIKLANDNVKDKKQRRKVELEKFDKLQADIKAKQEADKAAAEKTEVKPEVKS